MKTLQYETDNRTVAQHPYIDDVLIYDIETDGLNTDTANMKFFGAYSYRYKKYFLINATDEKSIQKLLDEHRVHVGFNNKGFDAPILERYFSEEVMFKIQFDCLAVLYDYERKRPNREPIIKLKDGRQLAAALPNRKLKTVAEVLGFPVEKGDIDYRIFQKNDWTDAEIKEICLYLYKDLDITRRIFEYYVEYFDGFRDLVDDDNISKFNYIRSSPGSFAYSAICFKAGLPVAWPDEDDDERNFKKPENDGGFVLAPQVEEAHGFIIYGDFSSLYPNLMFMCNVFSPMKNGWRDWGIAQAYNNIEQGVIEKTLREMYITRAEMKKNKDPRELGYKIAMNAVYGISGSPIFKTLFNEYTPGDITTIGRGMIQYTKKYFEGIGCSVIYGDTDSCFIDITNTITIDTFKEHANIVTKQLLERVPFPSPDTFRFEIDDVFTDIWLFQKKMYAGFNLDGKLSIKGLPIIKHDCTFLGKKVFDMIQPLMYHHKTIKVSRECIMQAIDECLKEDITLAGREYNVKSFNSYKSKTSIQAQIAKEHGEGNHFLIANTKIGAVGKTKRYCTIEQAKTLEVSDLALEKTMKELEPFIEK